MKVLSVSDEIVSFIYSAQVSVVYGHVDFVIACGDLSYYYQEFIVSALNKPLFFVRGNHDPEVEYGEKSSCRGPRGGTDLHRRVVWHDGISLAGVEGCIRYNPSAVYQYTQSQMWLHVICMLPKLFLNRLRSGRFIDIFVSHAPPWGIHDKPDLPHHGVKAFRWLIRTFKPKYHFHGHTHVYRPDEAKNTQFGATQVINTYRYLETELEFDR